MRDFLLLDQLEVDLLNRKKKGRESDRSRGLFTGSTQNMELLTFLFGSRAAGRFGPDFFVKNTKSGTINAKSDTIIATSVNSIFEADLQPPLGAVRHQECQRLWRCFLF